MSLGFKITSNWRHAYRFYSSLNSYTWIMLLEGPTFCYTKTIYSLTGHAAYSM